MGILIIFGAILIILGVIGSFVPALPDPVFSYLGLVLLYLAKPEAVTSWWLFIFGSTIVLITVIDYIAPIFGAKFTGASRFGLIGCLVGSLLGLIFNAASWNFHRCLGRSFYRRNTGW